MNNSILNSIPKSILDLMHKSVINNSNKTINAESLLNIIEKDLVRLEYYKEHIIAIYADVSPTNPRVFSNVGTMVCSHGRHDFGDRQYRNDSTRGWRNWFAHYIKDTYSLIESNVYDNEECLSDNDVDIIWSWIEENVIVLPLMVYDHSGLSMGTSREYPFNCRWDSSQVGFIYVLNSDVEKEFWNATDKKERALSCLENEVAMYNHYLSGDVYGYRAFDKDGEDIGSCWGFYGYDDSISGLF